MKSKSLVLLIIVFVSITIIGILLFQSLQFHTNTDTPKYVGGEQCIECHQKEYKEWKGSDHDLAMDLATDESVKGDFNNAVFNRDGQEHKAYQRDGKYYVWTDGPEGKMEEFEIKYVFGHYPLQQYLVEFERGKYQTLALTWNSKINAWYYMADSVYADQNIDHNSWLHWTNQGQNWNGMCADCHSTNLQKNYNPEEDSYHTTWTDIDVNCEACHGPGSEHMRWAETPGIFKDSTDLGLMVNTSTTNNKEFVDQCARCHSRRNSFTDYTPQSKSIYQHMNPSLPMEPAWHIDGQILDEDYVYASFTQSKMYMHNVKCNNCHNVHTGKIKAHDNSLCAQCHLPEKYDTPEHHHHKSFGEEGQFLVSDSWVKMEVGSGTLCVNCHMHGQNYMGVDYRRDHSFRIPRPDLSIKMGVPNACNQCHKNETNEWAQNYIEKWYGNKNTMHFSEAIWAAIHHEEASNEMLHTIINDPLTSTKVKAICYYYLDLSIPENQKLIKKSLNAPSPDIRIAAIQNFSINSKEDFQLLSQRLKDDTRTVRMLAASILNSVNKDDIPKYYQAAFDSALAEHLEGIRFNLDFPSEKANMGNYYYYQQEYSKAEKYYKAALKQDSEMYNIKVNLAILLSQNGKLEEAAQQLEEYLQMEPEDYNTYYRYGLLLAEMKKYEEALNYLVIASKNLPQNSRVDYNIAMLYEFMGDMSLAEKYLELAVTKEPSNQQNYNNLQAFRRKHSLK